VLAPKLAVAQLIELGARTGASWLVAFSSISALLGAAGQANYAAANGWLDAHATWQATGTGPSVASIAWGTWAEVGMAAGNAKALERARQVGEAPLPSGRALSLFGKVIGSLLAGPAGGQFAACQLDWQHSPWAGLPLVGELPTEPAPRQPSEQPASPATAEPSGTAPAAADRIQSFLSDYIHRWDESKQLAELGLDSLDFARMRGDFARLFGKDVPLAVIAKPDQRLGELYSLLSDF
jgi:hypothetical protein